MNTVIWKTCSIYFSTKKYNCMTKSCYWFSLVLSYIKFFIKHWLWPLFFLKCTSYYHSNSYFLLDRVKHWKASWIILKISTIGYIVPLQEWYLESKSSAILSCLEFWDDNEETGSECRLFSIWTFSDKWISFSCWYLFA